MELAVSGPQAVKNNLAANHRPIGGVLEWSNRPVLKTGVVKATVGSNPTPSATSPSAKFASLSMNEKQCSDVSTLPKTQGLF